MKARAIRAGLAGLLVFLGISGIARAAPDPARGETPRAAMEAYLKACRAGEYRRAAGLLDLGALPPDRRQQEGPHLARSLKVVLDQTLWVDLASLSDLPGGEEDDGLRPFRDRVGSIRTERGDVDVFLDRQGKVWRISRETLAQLPALTREFGGGGWLEEILPRSMFQRFGELELWQWLGLILLVVAAWALGTLLASLIARAARRAVARTRTSLDDRLLQAALGPLTATLATGLFYTGSLFLRLAVPAHRMVGQVCKILVVVSVTWLAMRLLDLVAGLIEERLTARGETTAVTVLPIGRRITKVFLLIIAVLSGLQNLGYNVTGLIAGLGVGGLAVALAAQKTFENFFGAVSVLVDQPVKRGDFCRFGEKIGIVEDIGLRSTRIRTLDRTLITVPNAEFASLQIENFAARDMIRFYTVLGLRYETSADQLRHVLIGLRRLLLSHSRVAPDPARVRFVGFGAVSLDLEIYAYVTTQDWNEFLAIREDLLLRIIDVVEASGTGFAFPSQTLYLGRDEGLDEDRTREAEQQVRAWREDKTLNLPDFPGPARRDLRGTLSYPEPGSSLASGDPPSGRGS